MTVPVPPSWSGRDDLMPMIVLLHLVNLELLCSMPVFGGYASVFFLSILSSNVVSANAR